MFILTYCIVCTLFAGLFTSLISIFDVYNTRPRLKFTVYSLGGPCAPSFCTRAPKCQILRFRSQVDGFLWTNSYAQSASFHRPCAKYTIHRRKLGAPYWGSRRCPRRLRPRRVFTRNLTFQSHSGLLPWISEKVAIYGPLTVVHLYYRTYMFESQSLC